MNREEYIKEKFGRDPGFKVPDGYFEALFASMPDKLPAYPEAPRRADMSLWQRCKPYVYMAAMFGGIWLMLNVFNHVSGGTRLNLDNPPESVVLAMAEVDNSDLPLPDVTIDDYRLIDDLAETYSDIEEFEEDFDYNLDPEFRNMEIPEEALAYIK